ncbi:MAG: hypothetical protein ACQER9_03285 [Nanobdellota archaeon]
MNAKKAINKIAAVGAGVMLVGSSMLGASAASLNNYPQPFVNEDGEGDVQFVIGSGSTDDYLGAIDIATSLQASAVSEEAVEVEGSTETTIEGGYDLSGSNEFYLNYNIDESLDDDELPELLAEGIIDYDGSQYDYSQELKVEDNAKIIWDEEDNEPVLKLNLVDGDLWNYTFEMDDNFEAVDGESKYEESYSMKILGETYTIPADQSGVDTTTQLKMFGSDTSTYLDLNEPVTVDVEDGSYTIEVVGANSEGDDSDMILEVNGERKTVEQGKSYTINGLDVYIEDLFVTNIPELSASANVFVGSNEVVLGENEVEIDDETVDGLRSNVKFDDDDALESFTIAFDPEELDGDVSGFDEVEYIEAGDSVTDPLFGTFDIDFFGGNYELDDEDKASFEISTPSDDVQLTVETEDGEVSFEVYNINATNGVIYYGESSTKGNDGFVDPSSTIKEDNIFILNEDDGETITKIYELTDVDADENEIELENLITGKTSTYEGNSSASDAGDEIDDTGYFVWNVTEGGTGVLDSFDLGNESGDPETSDNEIYLEGGYQKLVIETDTIKFSESPDGIASDLRTESEEANMIIEVTQEPGETNAELSYDNSDKFEDASSRDEDTYNYLSIAGSYIVIDDDNEYVNGWAVQDEDTSVEYSVFVAPEGSSIVRSGASGDSVTTQQVNPIAVGAAVKAEDVDLADPSSNLIVVGGPCINSVAAELKGIEGQACGEASGINPGEAIIEMHELDNGKVAMLVAGWEAQETQAAARAVATDDEALTGDSVVLSVSSANSYSVKEQ